MLVHYITPCRPLAYFAIADAAIDNADTRCHASRCCRRWCRCRRWARALRQPSATLRRRDAMMRCWHFTLMPLPCRPRCYDERFTLKTLPPRHWFINDHYAPHLLRHFAITRHTPAFTPLFNTPCHLRGHCRRHYVTPCRHYAISLLLPPPWLLPVITTLYFAAHAIADAAMSHTPMLPLMFARHCHCLFTMPGCYVLFIIAAISLRHDYHFRHCRHYAAYAGHAADVYADITPSAAAVWRCAAAAAMPAKMCMRWALPRCYERWWCQRRHCLWCRQHYAMMPLFHIYYATDAAVERHYVYLL